MKFKRIVVGVLSLYVAAAWHVWAGESGSPVLGQLGTKEAITEADVSSYLNVRVDLRALSKNVWGVENIVREMTLTRALILEGESQGLPRQDGLQVRRFDDVYAQAVFKQMRPECKPPESEEASRKFYTENPKAFSVPPSARLNRVMLPKSATVAGEPAVGWLLSQIQAVGANTKTFDALVVQAQKIYNLDPQGDLGWVMLTDDISLLRALANSKEGDIVGPVAEGEFLYVFQIVNKRDGRVLPWQDVAVSAANRAVRYCREQGDIQIREKLAKKYNIKVETDAIRAMFNRFEDKK